MGRRGGLASFDVRPEEPAEHLFRRLLGAYLGGAEEFEITVEDRRSRAAAREVVKAFCRRTRQPEIVFDEGGVLRLRDAARESSEHILEQLRRMGRMVVDFHREAVRSWSTLSLVDEGFWDRRDNEIDRDAWQIQRWVSLQLGSSTSAVAAFGPWTVARSLERIADHAVVLGEVGGRFAHVPEGSRPATSLRQFHRQAVDHLESVLAAHDGEEANDLLDVGEALLQSGRSVADRLLSVGGTPPWSAAASVGIARISESIGRTIAYTQDIAQVLLDRPMLREAAPRRGPARAPPSQSLPLAAT